MRARRTVKERDIVKILVFGYDRTLIKSIKDSGFRSMSDVISYANNMVGDKPIDHIRVSNEARGWCGSIQEESYFIRCSLVTKTRRIRKG